MTFRITVTLAVMVFITALAACLMLVQLLAFHAGAEEAASAYMDAASEATVGRLQAQLDELTILLSVLSTNPFLADSDDRSEVGGAVGLFKTALHDLPQVDSIYVGYDNGCWIQVRGLDDLDSAQRKLLGAPDGAITNINLVRPSAGGALPMRRVFEDAQGNKIDQVDLWNYGYDARQRSWYRDTQRTAQLLISSPYPSFSVGALMVTISAPLKGSTSGIIAADLKLDKFSDFVNSQRPGKHGQAVLFDASGTLIAFRGLARLVDDAMTHPAHSKIPKIRELKDGMIQAVMRGWDGRDRYEGNLRADSPVWST